MQRETPPATKCRPMPLNRDNAALYLLALWPLGLAKPEIATSYPYSALSQWRINLAGRLAKIPDLLPLVGGPAECSI